MVIFSMNNERKQQGVALITVLLIISIVTVISVEIAFNHKLSVAKTTNRFANLHILEYVYGVEKFIASVLVYDGKQEDKTDSLKDSWSQAGSIVYPLPNGVVKGEISDLSGKININDLFRDNKIDNITYTRFKRLFTNLDIDLVILNAIIDWIDEDVDPIFPGGAEDDYYLSLESPYRTANKAFSSLDELRLVKGIDDEIFKSLEPHISTVPEKMVININTASKEVLKSLATHISDENADTLIEEILESPFQSVNDFKKHKINKSKIIKTDNLDTKSQYFSSLIQVRFAQTTLSSNSFFKRDKDNKVSLIQREIAN